ncbi:MAG TPA: SAVED domain-containing protein [Gemmatimonadales bacterium]|nr:SAVED domain-containing protein [Gemmatimonadales bacterium]
MLLAMTIRPFLSHRRENAGAVARLRKALKIHGAGGWKDTEDLRVGEQTREAIRRAIFEETGGFIWWGTASALGSRFINEVELPAAFERKARQPLYPIVPIFVDIDPGRQSDREAMHAALGNLGDQLLECNGLIRAGRGSAEEFRRRVASRYVRDAVRALADEGEKPITVAMRALGGVSGDHDLAFDWRSLIDPERRLLAPGAAPMVVDALAGARDALQAAFPSPSMVLDLDLPLPLAFLVGYEWRVTARLRLGVRQRTGSSFSVIWGEGEARDAPEPKCRSLGGTGPSILAVSCRDGFEDAALRYADEIGAREVITLHRPGILGASDLRALARAAAEQLRKLNNKGIDKHLLILGPAALAVFAGAAANATGPVTIPFWDGTSFVGPLVVGATQR